MRIKIDRARPALRHPETQRDDHAPDDESLITGSAAQPITDGDNG